MLDDTVGLIEERAMTAEEEGSRNPGWVLFYWALAKRALESGPVAMVHAGPFGRSRAHPLSCESLGSLVGVTRLGS